MSIRVLHITGAMNMGGAEVMLMDLLRHKSDDVDFDFLVNYKKGLGKTNGDFDQEIKSLGSKLYYIAAQWDIGPLSYAKELKKICATTKPDIIHIHMNAKSGIIAWAAKKADVSKIIVHSHADLKIRGHWAKVFLSKLELSFQKKLISKYATHFWGCSDEANKSLFYEDLLDGKRSAVINNAIDTKKFTHPDMAEIQSLRKSYGLSEETLILGNVGRVVRHKNIGFILQVLAHLKIQGVKAAFVFAGRAADESYMDEFWKEVNELGIQKDVIHLGVRSDVEVVMGSFDVFVGPALQEGFGLVAVEAQAAGLPTVLYKGFPTSVDTDLGLVTFLQNFNTEEWTKAVTKKIFIKEKEDRLSAIKSVGLDAQQNAEIVGNLYMNL